jgi:UPF0716 protein FxsA
MWLFILFVAVPIIEIALFIQVGGWLGLWQTLGIVVLTAAVGTVLVRTQGLQTIRTLQANLERGGDPVGPIAHGALILLAGVLLLTPGFFTDAVAVALLVPPIRAAVIRWGAARLTVIVAGGVRRPPPGSPHPGSPHPGSVHPKGRGRPETVDAEYEVLNETPSRETGKEHAAPRRQGDAASRPRGNGDAGRQSQWTRPPR